MKKGPVTPKGFKDILPEVAKRRREVINKIANVLESYGFVPLETPTLEFADTLLGKYGEEEKLIYQLTDKGGRKLALRYDLTVPLARFVANNPNLLNPIFCRYQIGQVFRGENPQKGRKREFTQFDFDSVGSDDTSEDVRVISATIKGARAIGLKNAILQINDRNIFGNLGFSTEAIRIIDKFEKTGKTKVLKDLEMAGIKKAEKKFNELKKAGETDRLKNIISKLQDAGFKYNIDFIYNPFLARGLDYYTSTIMELKLDKTSGGLSIGGGGRYDNLIGMFAGKSIPAVGFSFGIDRLIELSNK